MTYTTKTLVEAEIQAETPFSSSTFPTDVQVDQWIDETDSYINKKAGRTYASTQYTVLLDYDGEETIHMENAPIISVDTFNYAQIALGATGYPDYAVKTEDTHFTTDNDRGEIDILSSNFSPSLGRKRFQITYTAGYAETPGFIEMLATKLVAKRVIDSVLEKDVREKQSGKSIGVGSINIVKPSDFGVNQYKNLMADIDSLKKEIVGTNMAYRYK